MSLSNDLISQFAKATNNIPEMQKETIVYGTIVKQDTGDFVKLDGAELLTPVTSTTVVKNGERVTVIIKNHVAIVTGNISSPSAQNGDLEDVSDTISDFEIVIADKVSTEELDAEKGRIDDLITDNVLIKETLTANEAIIGKVTADNITINEKLIANEAEFEDIKTHKLDATVADLKFATIENLTVTDMKVHNLVGDYGEFKELSTDKFSANEATIKKLETEKLSSTEADLKYANIEFTNIGKAALEEFFAKSGLIENVVIGDGTITGNLVGVTIKGDLIEGGTIVADKLVIKGSDGLYYKLNTDGMTIEAEQTDHNSLNGSIITAKSITATKINVKDLVAFGATIGGFKITDHSLYSGVKESIGNTTRGIYLDDTGQLALGDGNSHIKYYKDTDGRYKLSISAEEITFGVNKKNVEEAIEEVKEEISTIVAIESTRGVMFKNSAISTTLIVVVYHGKKRITDMSTLMSIIGSTASLKWKWKRFNEESFNDIPSNDPRIGSDGFMLTLHPGDVDIQVVFMCELIT